MMTVPCRKTESLRREAPRLRSAALRIAALVLLAVGALSAAPAGEDLAAMLKAAKPGDVVTLPAGKFTAGIELPEGVSLRGAGFDKTILDAAGKDTAILCRGKKAAAITDLAVVGALQTGILADGADGLTIERVSVRKCVNGLLLRQAANCRAVNVILADNRAGALVTGSTGCSLVNATLANNFATALLLSGCTKATIFNNLMVGSQMGVSYGTGNQDVTLDHNLYCCNFIGRIPEQRASKHIGSWRDTSSLDRRSLFSGIEFAKPTDGDYHVAGALDWAPDRGPNSDMGAAELAGVKAPEKDMDGKARSGRTDLGAFETVFKAAGKADGAFEVKGANMLVSAGLFNKEGRNVAFLFHNLPLAPGKYTWTLPSRDWQGRPIAAGDYELRLTESDLRLKYLMPAGNGDPETGKMLPSRTAKRATGGSNGAVFDPSGDIILAQNGFEVDIMLRRLDGEMQKVAWYQHGSGCETAACLLTDNGQVLLVRRPSSIMRVDAKTGKGIPFGEAGMTKHYEKVFESMGGGAWLDGKVYVTDTKANKVVCLAGDLLDVSGSVNLPSPGSIAADPKAKLLWVISEEKLKAIDPSGAVKFTPANAPAKPALVAFNAGILAVHSAQDNKVTLFDAADPANLKALRTIGKGGDEFGPIEPTKFWKPNALAVGPKGELLVSDPIRTMVFNADGSVRRHHTAFWGQGITYGRLADGKRHFFNIGGTFDMALDPKVPTWTIGTRWKPTPGVPKFYFGLEGRNFGMFMPGPLVLGELLADGSIKPLRSYAKTPQGLQVFSDTDGDGSINPEKDKGTPINGPDGKPIPDQLWEGRSHIYIENNVMVLLTRPRVAVVPLKGMAGGAPNFDFSAMTLVTPTTEGKGAFVSPFDFKTEEAFNLAEDIAWHGEQGFASGMTIKTGSGPDLCTEHANATQMAGFDKGGSLRWFRPMNPVGLKVGLHCVTGLPGLTLVSRGAICEVETMDLDGLGTGTMGVPADMGWGGMWLDNHGQMHAFSEGGKSYLIIGDYCAQAYHWFEVTGLDKMKRQAVPVAINGARASELAALPAKPFGEWPAPPVPNVLVKKLSAPLTMDGDVEKWRKLNVPPVVITPDMGGGDSPLDNSAVVRYAYFGDKIYVCIIKFDDVVTFHHTNINQHFQQDGIEMAINTYPSGFKFNVTKIQGKDVIYRDTWNRGEGTNRLLTPEEAPRVIKVLDNAKDLADRALIEPACGKDMSNAKAIVIEFVLPKSVLEPMERPELNVDLSSGKTFRLGFMINDNDVPGSDMFDPIVWPVTYSTFERVEKNAIATFE